MSIFVQQDVFGFYVFVNNATLVKKLHGEREFCSYKQVNGTWLVKVFVS